MILVKMFYLFLFVLFVCVSTEELPLLCTKCDCDKAKNTVNITYDVTCKANVVQFVFDDSFWLTEDKKIGPYSTLTVQNVPIVSLDKTFPVSNLTYLNLANNSIVNITDGVFKNLQDMITLVLSYNKIEVLHPNAFDGKYLEGDVYPLKSLKNLHLDYNRIHSLDGDIFEHATRVEVLSLSHNPMKVIDHQTWVAITSLVFLKKLDLSYTGLASLPDTFLHTPKHLEFLDLSGNDFKEIPKTLEDSHNLSTLYFNDNPIVNLTSENGFPNISTLKTLHLSFMRNLINISQGAMSNLSNLEDLYCFQNPELTYIDHAALSARRDGAQYETWPPIRKLYLQDNKLSSIDMQVILQWKDLTELDLTNNPWTCECENQWIVDELMPIYLRIDELKAKSLKCAAPIEMVAFTFYDVYTKESTMRCLDLYGNRPERDGALLVGILAGVLITIPLILFIIYSYQRHWFGIFDSSPAAFSRQFYKRTVSSEDGYF